MKSEWRVFSNPVDGEVLYGVYRLCDDQKIMYDGNMEVARYYDCKEDARHEAKRRNENERDIKKGF